MEWGQ